MFFTRSLTAEEFLYLNQWNEIALLSVGNLSERILMSNTTYVSIILLYFASLPSGDFDCHPLFTLLVIYCYVLREVNKIPFCDNKNSSDLY